MQPCLPLNKQFSEDQLARILEQSVIYACACPAQVCKTIFQNRELFAYQTNCLNSTHTDAAVHRTIADCIRRTHAELEICLEDVLKLEGWNLLTLEMPVALQKRILGDFNRGN